MEWIKVEDRLPQKGVVVIIYKPFDDVLGLRTIASLEEDNRWFRGMSQIIGVTHWMPLPEPPKQ